MSIAKVYSNRLNGRDAIQAVQENKIDIVLMDVMVTKLRIGTNYRCLKLMVLKRQQ